MFKKRKAQAAMEFLMTYGWAILIVLAVIATLAAFGVLNTDMFLKEKCVFTIGAQCSDYKIERTATTGEITLKLTNGGGEDYKITNVAFSGRHLGSAVCGGGFNADYVAPTGYSSIMGSYTAAVEDDESTADVDESAPAEDSRYLDFPRDSTILFKVGSDGNAGLMFSGGDCSAISRTSKGRKFNADVEVTYYKGADAPSITHPIPGQISITVENKATT